MATMTLSSGEFASNMLKYYREAKRGIDIVVQSAVGSFRIVPLTNNHQTVNDKEKQWKEMLNQVSGAWKGCGVPEDLQAERKNKNDKELLDILNT